MSFPLRDKLWGPKQPLREKLAELVTGSYTTQKTPEGKNIVTERPNIVERIAGKESRQYMVAPTEPLQQMEERPYQNIDPSLVKQELGKPEKVKSQNMFTNVKRKISDLFDGDDMSASAIESVPEVTPAPPIEPTLEPTDKTVAKKQITKDKLVFREHGNGDGLPYIKNEDGTTSSLGEVYKQYQPTAPQKPINKIVITDPEEGQYVIDTPEKLAIANEIKAIADEVAPEYTNYLLKLAQKEGGYDRKALRDASKNPGGGDDRGIFQINSKYFPDVTDEMAQDIRFSVLWAISLIESDNPRKGDGARTGQEKWIADPAVKRSTIEIE